MAKECRLRREENAFCSSSIPLSKANRNSFIWCSEFGHNDKVIRLCISLNNLSAAQEQRRRGGGGLGFATRLSSASARLITHRLISCLVNWSPFVLREKPVQFLLPFPPKGDVQFESGESSARPPADPTIKAATVESLTSHLSLHNSPLHIKMKFVSNQTTRSDSLN